MKKAGNKKGGRKRQGSVIARWSQGKQEAKVEQEKAEMMAKMRAEAEKLGVVMEDSPGPAAPELPAGDGFCAGAASVQYKGKGKFHDVWLSLEPGKPELAFRDGGRDGEVLRTAPAEGCTISTPKQARKGHEIALRVDLTAKDSKGDAKYIISVETEEELERWKSGFSYY